MVLRKDQLETKLKDDNQLILSGVLRNEHPLDISDQFRDFLQACRRGDLKECQEMIMAGVNINGKDQFDYTPLIIASLCGHFELVQLLLESGALADPDSFERERAVYNALNAKIRNLLLSYDYSKAVDPLQPWASHITSLLSRAVPKTADITLSAAAASSALGSTSGPDSESSFELHKFILSARSPYFRSKFAEAPETSTWRLANAIPVEAFRIVLRYLYLGDLPRDLVRPTDRVSEEEVARGIDKLCKQLQLEKLWEAVLSMNDRRLARQRRQDEVQRAQGQVDALFRDTVLRYKVVVETRKVADIKWPHDNAIFANCLLRADEAEGDDEEQQGEEEEIQGHLNGMIPIGPPAAAAAAAAAAEKTSDGVRQDEQKEQQQQQRARRRRPRRSVLFPVHKAFLIRSPYFETMFSSDFLEARDAEYLHIIKVDCVPEVLETILTFLYTEKSDCPLDLALDLLYTSDMLLLDKLKAKAATTISTLGSGNSNVLVDRTHSGAVEEGKNAGAATDASGNEAGGGAVEVEVEPINVYDVIHAAWDLKVQRLEEFAARYLAYRLEDYIDEPEFAELIRESAARLRAREETDTIELLDDIRYYLSERFRLRFEGDGIEEMLDDEQGGGVSAGDSVVAGENGEGLGMGKEGGEKTEAEVRKPTEAFRAGAETGQTEMEMETGMEGAVRTLDGELVEDEFVSDALNYQILLRKIDDMLERLELDA